MLVYGLGVMDDKGGDGGEYERHEVRGRRGWALGMQGARVTAHGAGRHGRRGSGPDTGYVAHLTPRKAQARSRRGFQLAPAHTIFLPCHNN